MAGENARACIYIKGLRTDLWARHCCRNLTAVRVQYKRGKECEMVVASAYFPYDVDASLLQTVRDLIRDCEAEKIGLVIGCDKNSHHTVWESTDCNVRGKDLDTTNLDILNIGCKPTLKNASTEEVIDITLASAGVWSWLRTWKVSEEIFMSDHNHITSSWRT